MARKKKKKIEKKAGRSIIIITAVAVLIGGIFVFWAARKDMRKETVPDYLNGIWISAAPAYHERYLEISDVSLIFATGPATVTEYFITNLTTAAQGKEILFTFDCKDLENTTYQFLLTYQPDNGGTLSFKNQPQVKWTKEPS